MELSQRNKCIGILNKQNVFFLEKQRTGRENRSCLGVGTTWRGEYVGRGYRRVNMEQILCIHVCKWKSEAYLNYSRNGGRGNKGE
jgi:hypothetical protein